MSKNKFSVLNILTEPWESITRNIVFFVLLTVLFSFVLLSWSVAFGQTFSCMFDQGRGGCTLSAPVYSVYFLVKILILSVFTAIWYAKVFQNKTVNEIFLMSDWRLVLRVFAVFLIFLILNMIPLLSIYLLMIRVPNPNWKIETAYFVFVSLGFWVPFILMRLYGLLADLIGGCGWKNYVLIWKSGQGNGIKLLLASSLYFFFVLVLFSGVTGMVRNFGLSSPIMTEFVGELSFDAVTLLATALFLGYFKSLRDNICLPDD